MLIANPVDEMWRTWQPICDDTSANAVALDVYENDDQYIVTAALPCMHVDNVKLHDDFLTIEGGVPEQTVENARPLMQEPVYGRFNCTVRFPQPINWYAVEANFKNDVLTVTLSKVNEAQPHLIPVKGGGNEKRVSP